MPSPRYASWSLPRTVKGSTTKRSCAPPSLLVTPNRLIPHAPAAITATPSATASTRDRMKRNRP
ncbi:MAG: hypothetical protein K0S86_3486, partial [Geminicoccaceae bacterium]|nr:hypothetical protein [Geminicoccaceae bacterium]